MSRRSRASSPPSERPGRAERPALFCAAAPALKAPRGHEEQPRSPPSARQPTDGLRWSGAGASRSAMAGSHRATRGEPIPAAAPRGASRDAIMSADATRGETARTCETIAPIFLVSPTSRRRASSCGQRASASRSKSPLVAGGSARMIRTFGPFISGSTMKREGAQIADSVQAYWYLPYSVLVTPLRVEAGKLSGGCTTVTLRKLISPTSSSPAWTAAAPIVESPL